MKTKLKMSYAVAVYFGGGPDKAFEALLEKAAKKRASGSGTFLADMIRDVSFSAASKKEAEELVKRLRSVKGKRKRVQILEFPD